jgi:hypothetical protein
LPEPEAPDVIVSQDASLEADQLHDADTVTLNDPPPTATLCARGLSAYEQGVVPN